MQEKIVLDQSEQQSRPHYPPCRRVQFNNLGFRLITGILHGKSKCDIHNHLIL